MRTMVTATAMRRSGLPKTLRHRGLFFGTIAAGVILLLLLTAGVLPALAGESAASAASESEAESNISESTPLPTVGLVAGESRLLRVNDLKRVAVADPSVADVVVASTGEVLLIGKAPGTTTLHVWEKDTVQAYLLRVFVDTSATEKELSALIDRPGVSVKVVRDTIILEGTVANAAERDRARRLAEAFFGRVVDLLAVPDSPPSPPPDVMAAEAIADPDIKVSLVGAKIVLEGTVSSQFAKERAVALAGAFGREVVDLIVVQPPKREAPAGTSGAQAAGDQTAGAGKASSTPDAKDIAAAIGDEGVGVRQIGGTFFLEGTVDDEFRAVRAEKIASALAPRVVNLVRVVPPSPPEVGPKEQPEKPALVLQAEEEAKKAREEAAAAARARDEALAKLDAAAKAAADREALLAKVKPFLPDGVTLTLIDGRLVASGTVESAAAKAEAEQLLRAFFPDAVLLIGVREAVAPAPQSAQPPAPPEPAPKPSTPTPALSPELMPYVEQAVQAASGASKISIADSAGRLVLTGKHPNSQAQARVRQAVEAFGAPVLDLTTVERPAQVLLQVEMVEITRDGMDRLGISWGSNVGGVFEENQIMFTVPLPPAPNAGIPQPLGSLEARLDALAKDGKARLLAAPSLVTLDGKEAEFLAGGEIPVAIPDKDRVTVYWKEYGVKLKMLPTLGEPGYITVHARPEVSTLDWANGAKIDVATLPALKTRRVETEVRLKEGQTLVIGGLITSEESQWVTKLPVLGDLPVLGTLFKSNNFQRNETQLIVFVTPRVVADGESPSADELTRPTVPGALSLDGAPGVAPGQRALDGQTPIGPTTKGR